LNTIVIPPQTLAIILTPAWNNTNTLQKDIPTNAIILTLKTATYWGGNNSSSVPNGLLFHNGDYVILYDGNPTLPVSQMIDSVVWSGSQGFDWSIQRDNDCDFRWHNSAPNASIGGFFKDLDFSLLANHSFGITNFNAEF